MKPEKIYIYPSLGGGFSMNRYLEGVVEGLEANSTECEIVRPRGAGLMAKYLKYPVLVWRKRNLAGKHLIISERYAYLLYFLKSNSIVVCHDLHTLYPLSGVKPLHRIIYRFFLKAMNRADKIVCVSKHTQNDLEIYAQSFKESNKVMVVHNGIEELWVSKEQVNPKRPPWFDLFERKKVLVSIGTDSWYKNNHWSIGLFLKLNKDYHLLRIGDFNKSNRELIERHRLQDRITEVTKVSDEQLKYAYERAEYLLFPSLSEGFGWPALEAALCGCSIVADDYGTTSEIFPDSGALISLNEAEEFILSGMKKPAFPIYKLWKEQVKLLVD